MNRRLPRAEDFYVGEGRFLFNPFIWKTPDTYAENFKSLPESSGIYLLVSCTFPVLSFRIQYIGMSLNLSRRFDGPHHILDTLRNATSVMIFFKEFEPEGLRQVERDFIRHFNPPLNSQGKILEPVLW